MAGQTPPPVAASDPGADVTKIPRTGGERVKGMIGGILDAGGGRKAGSSQLEQEVEKHYGARLDEAKMHRRNATTYAGILASGINPQTGEKLTDEEKQQYQNWYNASWNAYQKIAGVTKETKGVLAKGKAILEHIIGRGQQAQGASGTPQAGAGATPPATSTPAATPAGASAGGGGGGTPGAPKGMTPPPQMSDLDAATLNAPEAAAGLQRNQDFSQWSRVEEVQHKHKMEEAKAKPHHLQKVNVKRQGSTEVESAGYDPEENRYYDQNGEVIPDATLVAQSAMTPKRFLYLAADAKGKKNIPRFGIQEGENLYDLEHKLLPPDTTPLMRGLIGTESISTDQFGNRVVTVRHPLTGEEESFKIDPETGKMTRVQAGPSGTPSSRPAAPGGAGAAPAPKAPSGAPGAAAGPGSATGQPAQPGYRPGASFADWGLDADGHIPPSGGNEQVRELANRLLDGEDVNKLPMKGRTPASMLARKYGWEQGKFTPKEQVQIRVAAAFIKKAIDDPNWSALNENLWQRLKTGQAAATPDKEGFFGKIGTTIAAKYTSEKEANFIEMYNQLVGTISGLSKLVRPGATTESQIERLKAELPNPYNTKNAAHAILRLKRLQNEITIALQKGNFEVEERRGTPTPPPMIARPGPKVGDIEDGHRFKGGDPSKKENWEKVKK